MEHNALPVLEAIDDPTKDDVAIKSRRRRHWAILAGSIAVILLAGAMTVIDGDRVALGGHLLPPTCASRTLFGVSCPGCGLTRSFVLLAHGDWSGAWQMHRIGWLLALATVAQIPYRIAALRFPHLELLGTLLPKFFGYLLFGLVIGNWLIDHVPRMAP